MINLDSAVANPQQLRQLRSELRGQPGWLVETLIRALRGGARGAGGELDVRLWGPRPSRPEVRRTAAANLALGIGRRRAVVEASLTRAEVAERLGKTAQAVSAMLERGALIGLKEGREWRVPTWQLDPNQVDGVLPGLRDLTRAYRDGIVSLSEWVERPHPDLDDAAPREILARGDVDRAIAAARTE